MSVKGKIVGWGAWLAAFGALAGVASYFIDRKLTIENEHMASITPLLQLNVSTLKVNAFNSDSASKKEVDSLVRKSDALIEYTNRMGMVEKMYTAKWMLSAAEYFSQTAKAKAAFKVDSSFNAEMKAKREQFMRQTRANKLNKHIQQGHIRQQARVRMF